MGMTTEDFWKKDPSLVKAFRKAYEERKKREFDETNRAAWLHGMYIYNAICMTRALFNPFTKSGTRIEPYFDEPVRFYHSREEAQQAEIEKLRADVFNYFNNME